MRTRKLDVFGKPDYNLSKDEGLEKNIIDLIAQLQDASDVSALAGFENFIAYPRILKRAVSRVIRDTHYKTGGEFNMGEKEFKASCLHFADKTLMALFNRFMFKQIMTRIHGINTENNFMMFPMRREGLLRIFTTEHSQPQYMDVKLSSAYYALVQDIKYWGTATEVKRAINRIGGHAPKMMGSHVYVLAAAWIRENRE